MEGGPVSDTTASRIQALRGGGSPIDGGIKSQVENTLGAQLPETHVHTGSEASAINRTVGAKAFTTGSDIVLGEGASTSDTSLMAHELTHVAQQSAGVVDTGGKGMQVTSAGDQYEQHADEVARSVSTNVPISQSPKNDE